MCERGVPEVGDGAGGGVDRVAASSALAKYLPVLHAGQDVFDPCAEAAVFGQAGGVVCGWQCCAGHGAVAAVGQCGDPGGQGGNGLIVDRDEGSVQAQGVGAVEFVGDEQPGDGGGEIADGSMSGGLANVEDGRQGAFGEVGAQRDQCQQPAIAVGQPWRAAPPMPGIGSCGVDSCGDGSRPRPR